MMQKTVSYNFSSLVMLSLIGLMGCGQNGKLNDQSSVEEQQKIEYADFSEFPLPDIVEETVGAEPVPPSPTPAAPEQPAPAPQPQPTPAPPKTPQPVQKMTGAGTVYYLPVYGEKRNCGKDEQAYIKDESDKILAKLCKAEVTNCGLQGSCFYVDESGVSLFAYKKTVEIKVPETGKVIHQYRFRLNKEFTKCPNGMGAWKVCVDPYRSIAADPVFHKIGSVVFVPLLVGKKLPNNEIHDGYFIVRDTGGRIKGEGRFDFFIGFDNYRGHLFTNLKLNDKHNGKFTYYRVPEAIAEKVRLSRAYPSVPAKVHEQAYSSMMSVLKMDGKNALVAEEDIEFFKMKWN